MAQSSFQQSPATAYHLPFTFYHLPFTLYYRFHYLYQLPLPLPILMFTMTHTVARWAVYKYPQAIVAQIITHVYTRVMKITTVYIMSHKIRSKVISTTTTTFPPHCVKFGRRSTCICYTMLHDCPQSEVTLADPGSPGI